MVDSHEYWVTALLLFHLHLAVEYVTISNFVVYDGPSE